MRTYEDFQGLVNRVLSKNSRCQPCPTEYDALQESVVAFESIILKLQKLCVQSQENRESFSKHGKYDPYSVNYLVKFKAPTPPFDSVHELLQQAAVLRQGHTQQFITTSEVTRVKELLKGFVLLPFDKNAGKTAVVCPTRMHAVLKSSYLEDSEHYRWLRRHNESSLMDKWTEIYRSRSWRSIAPFHNGSVPYAYSTRR